MVVDTEGVVVNLKIAKDFQVREGDKIETVTQTLLGDKVVEIKSGPITASLVGPDQVIRGVDETTHDLMVKALIEIISSAPADREKIMDKWRSWLELNGLWPKGQQLDERRKVGEAGK